MVTGIFYLFFAVNLFRERSLLFVKNSLMLSFDIVLLFKSFATLFGVSRNFDSKLTFSYGRWLCWYTWMLVVDERIFWWFSCCYCFCFCSFDVYIGVASDFVLTNFWGPVRIFSYVIYPLLLLLMLLMLIAYLLQLLLL